MAIIVIWRRKIIDTIRIRVVEDWPLYQREG